MYKSFKIIIGNRDDLNHYLLLTKKHNLNFRWNYIKNLYEARKQLQNNRSLHIEIKYVTGFWRLYMHIDRHIGNLTAPLHKVLQSKDETNRLGKRYLEFGNWKGILVE